jgi:2-oxoglutarate ferredoxin oxidoreductase subunit beta
MASEQKLKPQDFQTEVHNDWCPGCGDFGILRSLQMALAEIGKKPHEVVIFSGIGCSGKVPHYVHAYGVHTLHGRVLPFATGAKLANPKLEVIAVGGDGDGMGIGAGHFVNAARRNLNMAYLIHDNQVYGLTKGQASPTLKMGLQTKGLAKPNIQGAINPLWLAMASGATFVARAYSFDVKHLVATIRRAIRHKGYAFVDVLQPCPTYNNLNTKDWYGGVDRKDPESGRSMPRVRRLEDEGFDPVVHEPEEEFEKLSQALKVAMEWGDTIPIGVFFQNEHVPTFEDRIQGRIPGYLDMPPAADVIADAEGTPTTDLAALFEALRVG